MELSRLKLLFVVCVLPIFYGCSKTGATDVIILNQSSETIVMIQVQVNEKIQVVENLKHGEEINLQFLVTADSSYELNVKFLSGNERNEKVGYLTRGVEVSDQITIKQSSINFDRKNITTN